MSQRYQNHFTLIIILVVLLSGCRPKDKPEESVKSATGVLSEVITKSYSVKQVDNQYVKDTLNMEQSITYDESGREKANIYHNLDGTIGWRDEYIYNEDGHKIGSKFYENGEKLTTYYKYEIDSLGRKVSYQALDITTDTLLYSGVSLYEENGRLRKDGYLDEDGEFRWNLEYQSDESGKELGYVFINLLSGGRYPASYKYTKYNDEGKWIERQLVEEDTVRSMEIREFKYTDKSGIFN